MTHEDEHWKMPVPSGAEEGDLMILFGTPLGTEIKNITSETIDDETVVKIPGYKPAKLKGTTPVILEKEEEPSKMFNRIEVKPDREPLKLHSIKDVPKKAEGDFFNTHIDKGWCITSPVPLMARLFGKRLKGQDSGVKCSGIYYKGVLYVTKMEYPREPKGWKILGVK